MCLIDIKTLNSDAATFDRPTQAINNDIYGIFFLGILSKVFQLDRAFE